MRGLFILIFLLSISPVFAQKLGDTRIVIKSSDTANIYQRTKLALINADFQVKDDGRRDTITTYSLEVNGIHCILQASFTDNLVTLFGVYGLKKIDYFGYNRNPGKYKQIIYYKGSKGWKLMQDMAKAIGGEISYIE